MIWGLFVWIIGYFPDDVAAGSIVSSVRECFCYKKKKKKSTLPPQKTKEKKTEWDNRIKENINLCI